MTMIKALFSLLILCSIIFALSACGGEDKKEDEEPAWKLEARTVGDVVFEDQELANCVRAALDLKASLNHPSELKDLVCGPLFRPIFSINGLEKLSELEHLSLFVGNISTYNFSENRNLRSLHLGSDYPEVKSSLNLRLNSELQNLYIEQLNVESLDLSQNGTLNTLNLENMPLKYLTLNTEALLSLDIKNTELEELELDISPKLKSIILVSNKLTDIKIGGAPSLSVVKLNNNPLSSEMMAYLSSLPDTVSVDVLAQHEIDGIYFEDVGLANCLLAYRQQLNLQDVREIQGLSCYNSGIRSLAGIENLTELRTAAFDLNALTSLEPLENLVGLESIRAWNNDLRSVDLSRLSKLERVNLSQNPNLLELKLPQSDIVDLSLSGVSISALDVSAYEKLERLYLVSAANIETLLLGDHPMLRDLTLVSGTANDTQLPVFANLRSLSVDARLISADYLMQISNLKYLSLMSTEAIFDDLDLSKNKALEKVGLFGELSGTLQIDYNPNLPYVTLPVEHDFRVIKNDHELQGHIFADADLITCIEDHLNVLGDGALLSEITTLNCDGYDIVSLKGIEALWNLQRLSLLNTRVSRVELLNFNRLKEFLISSPILTKLDMSQYELEVFHIENSPITAIFLTSTNLREISVTNVPLRRLSIVHAESSLESLTLLNTEISSFDTNRYPRLKYVDIQ